MKLAHIFLKDWWLGKKIELEGEEDMGERFAGLSDHRSKPIDPPTQPSSVIALFTDDKGFWRMEKIDYPPKSIYKFAVIPALQASYMTGDNNLNTPGISPYAQTMTFIKFEYKGMDQKGQALYTQIK